MTKSRKNSVLPILFLAALALLPAAAALAEEQNCAACHEDLSTGKSVHPAVMMGCASCHTAVDASVVPHKITNRNPKGLNAKMRDLCYGCHEKKNFQKTTVHGALMLGCTSCHNPHASDHARVLKDEIPRLCLHCHEEKLGTLTALNNASHAHAKTDRCSDCHSPHSSDAPKLVLTKPQGNGGKTALIQKPSVPQQ